jgi:hypothetical protein
MPPRKINLPFKNYIKINALSARSAPEKNPGHEPRAFPTAILEGLVKSLLKRHPAESRGPEHSEKWIPAPAPGSIRGSPESRILSNFDFLRDHHLSFRIHREFLQPIFCKAPFKVSIIRSTSLRLTFKAGMNRRVFLRGELINSP